MSFNKNNGITLIALVITIIVLLILAGVTFNSILGPGSILDKAAEARDKYKNAEIEESRTLSSISSGQFPSAPESQNSQGPQEPDWSKYTFLYNQGDTCDSLTGGWNNNLGARTSSWTTYATDLSGSQILLEERISSSQWTQMRYMYKKFN